MRMRNPLKNILEYIALAGFAISVTILFLGMRSVMGIGGFCAEGGAYEIAVHCPKGIAGMVPLSIFGMLISGGAYLFTHRENTPNFAYLFWTALFGSLGWNFLEFAFYPPDSSGIVISWIICGVMFEFMAIGPLFLRGENNIINQINFKSIKKEENSAISVEPNKILLIILGLAVVGAGIYFGISIFNYFSA